MAVAVIVKAIGFSDSERSAFSTVLDLSPSRLCSYRLWTPSTRRDPDVFLFDGENSATWNEVSNLLKTTDKPFLWVGYNPPREAAHSFLRPVRWMSVMDALEMVATTLDLSALSVGTTSSTDLPALGRGAALDLDLDLGGGSGGLDLDLDLGFGTAHDAETTDAAGGRASSDALATATRTAALPSMDADAGTAAEPPTLVWSMLHKSASPLSTAGKTGRGAGGVNTSPQALGDSSVRRALLVNQSSYERMFLRTRLLGQGISVVDEVTTAKEAMARAQVQSYDLAIVDIDIPGVDGWGLAQNLRHAQYPVASVIMTSAKRSAIQSAKAKLAGLALLGGKPINAIELDRLLSKVAA